MSAELSIPPDNRAELLAQVERGEVATTLTGLQREELVVRISLAIDEAESVLEYLRDACGPQLSGLEAHLHVMAGMGAGHLRHCRDTLRALRRAKARL